MIYQKILRIYRKSTNKKLNSDVYKKKCLIGNLARGLPKKRIGSQMYEVKFSKKAEKSYEKLTNEVKLRIDQKLAYLRATPRGTDTKKLVGEQNVYRTRVGSYRIVYEIEDNKLLVWILDVDHRSSVYK